MAEYVIQNELMKHLYNTLSSFPPFSSLQVHNLLNSSHSFGMMCQVVEVVKSWQTWKNFCTTRQVSNLGPRKEFPFYSKTGPDMLFFIFHWLLSFSGFVLIYLDR